MFLRLISHQPMKRRRRAESSFKKIEKRDALGLVVVGRTRVGKSALVQRWVNDKYSQTYTPTVEEFYQCRYKHGEHFINFGIIDMGGTCWDFPAMLELYLSKADSVVFVYENGNVQSVKELKLFYQRFLKVKRDDHLVNVTIVGTKFDDITEEQGKGLEWQSNLAYQVGEEGEVDQENKTGHNKNLTLGNRNVLAKVNSMDQNNAQRALDEVINSIEGPVTHVKTSAKNNLNVNHAFQSAVAKIVENIIPTTQNNMQILATQLVHPRKKKSVWRKICCCCCCCCTKSES